MLKQENVRPLFPTALKLQEQLQKLHDLVQERIASNKEYHRIQIKVKVSSMSTQPLYVRIWETPTRRREDLLIRAKQ